MQRNDGGIARDDAARTALLLASCRRDAATAPAAGGARLLADARARECFVEFASRHGVLGLALATLQRTAGLDALPPEAAGALRETLRGLRRRATILMMERDTILDALRRRGVDAVVLKGAGLAGTVYGDPVERDYGDVDLLLPPEHIETALAALRPRGYEPQSEDAADGYRAHHFHLRVQRPRGAIVELHWDLVRPGEPFRLDSAAFRARSRPSGTTGLRVPSAEHALLHMVAENARDAFSRLTRLVDVDRIVGGAPGLDWVYVEAEARAGGLVHALSLALELSRAVLGTEVPDEVRRRLRPPAAVRVHLALLRPASSLLRQRALTRPSWGELLALWLLAGRSRARALLAMLRADADPLQWLWDGAESPADRGPAPGLRARRLGKVVAYQLGTYVTGSLGALAARVRAAGGGRRLGAESGIW